MTILLYHAESDCLFVEQYQVLAWNHIEHCDDVSFQQWAVDRYNAEVPVGRLHLFTDREDGLAWCSICRSGECEITTDCPGEKLTEEQSHLVCAGKLDFFSGVWL